MRQSDIHVSFLKSLTPGLAFIQCDKVPEEDDKHEVFPTSSSEEPEELNILIGHINVHCSGGDRIADTLLSLPFKPKRPGLNYSHSACKKSTFLSLTGKENQQFAVVNKTFKPTVVNLLKTGHVSPGE